MKKVSILTAFLILLITVSCKTEIKENSNSEFSSNNSSDLFQNEIAELLAQYNKGLKPGISLEKIKDFEPSVKEYFAKDYKSGEMKATGNFQSLKNSNVSEVEKFFTASSKQTNLLYSIRLTVVKILSEAEQNALDALSDEKYELSQKPLNLNEYANHISSVLGVKFEKGNANTSEEGIYRWIKDNNSFELTSYSSTDISFMIINQ